MRFGVIMFPGSNCDYDCWWAIKEVTGEEVDFIWHKEENITGFDCIVLPGGFSYGDYLRTGAIARFSPIMKKVKEFAERGGLVVGICNGFQILLEAGFLPGAMRKNKHLLFICKYIHLRVENPHTAFTNLCKKGQILRIPIAHFEGNYYATPDTLSTLQKKSQIIFRYCNKEGEITDEVNPNGSLDAIAGVCNERGNILGMMPHPERSCESILGSEDGKLIWKSIVTSLKRIKK
ncbi:phosphoribosylformylglycinamidine synthase subunit PurQ [Candidatus Aerophobetes bacterium]|nr:phosphoribosylformylglycinamidine synthase subunit PurQ [Candidatus Aerophobetes bacterium]